VSAILRRWSSSAAVVAIAALFVAAPAAHAAGQAPEAAAPSGTAGTESTATATAEATEYRAVLDRYCTTCHNDRLQTAGLTLESLDMVHVGAGAETWEKVIRKLRAREMPPPRRPRPDDATYVEFVDWIETELDRAAAADLNPGAETVHRLNRTEYTNAIRDLLALEIDGRELLPADDLSYGFDNIADVLSLSPSLLERYMLAAGKIAETAIGDPSIRSTTAVYTTSPVLMQHGRMSELHPFGSRGGFATRHYFPVAGEYEFKVTLERTHGDAIKGLQHRNSLEVRLDRARVARFDIGADGQREAWNAVFNLTPYERNADADLRFRMPVQAGMREVALSFLRRSALPEGVLEPVSAAETYHYAGDRDAPMAVWIVEIEGPFNGATASADAATPSRERIFTCLPDDPAAEPACAEEILGTLARRAFRRPVTEDDIAALMAFYDVGQAKGGFESGIEFALRAILVDPEFLFRIEQDPADAAPGEPYRISDLELASRLSFFLWSSIPDDELLDVAARGALRDEGVLGAQVQRMLADPKADALVDNFAGQWLFLRNMRSVKPDPVAFPEFDGNLREAFTRETELWFESQIKEDRSVIEVLTSDYTFANERLAKHYGIPDVEGNHFRRVTLPDERRRGILGQGSVLTATSYANRTSPVKRGVWVLENLLGAPPPPPPADVPGLEDSDSVADPSDPESRPRSVRERMERHRTDPVCASCHVRMDPLGFALEGFDAVGGYRELPVEQTSGTLPSGRELDGPASVREMLLANREEFVGTVTEKLLTYGLGRGVEYYDLPWVRRIVRQSEEDDYRWSSLILGIVESTPFQMRKAREQ
jgi:mono/diheme cytochrome c family protein